MEKNNSDKASIKAITLVLGGAYTLLKDLDATIFKVLRITGGTEKVLDPQESLKVSRRAWLLHEGRLVRLRDSLRDVRNRLNIGIAAFTS